MQKNPDKRYFLSFKKEMNLVVPISVGKHTTHRVTKVRKVFRPTVDICFCGVRPQRKCGQLRYLYAIRQGDSWSLPINPGRPLNSEYWESNPVLSVSGDELFFTSNRPPCLGR